MLDLAKKVYNLLNDSESKDIFLNRVFYNITGEEQYLDKLIFWYHERIKKNWEHPEYIHIIQELYKQIGDQKVIIYGAGQCGFVTMSLLHSVMKNIKLVAFCDKKARVSTRFFGYKILNIEELVQNYRDAIIIVTPVEKSVRNDIVSQLVDNGISKDHIISELPFDFWKIRGQYFDEVVQFNDKEVFIDVGCLNCVTTLDFIKRCPQYKEIVGFEPVPAAYEDCLKIIKNQNICNVQLYNMGLWNKKDELPFVISTGGSSHISKEGSIMIPLDTLDNILQGKEASFIKMDIEGAELNALQGCEKTIRKFKPKLAISVYHKIQDIIEIPLYIHGIVPEYKIYMRHYSINSNETVLYALKD